MLALDTQSNTPTRHVQPLDSQRRHAQPQHEQPEHTHLWNIKPTCKARAYSCTTCASRMNRHILGGHGARSNSKRAAVMNAPHSLARKKDVFQGMQPRRWGQWGPAGAWRSRSRRTICSASRMHSRILCSRLPGKGRPLASRCCCLMRARSA